MLSKRLIPCLDVRAGRVTKGVKFQNNLDIGDPVELARRYDREGADEIVFYDIGASPDGQPILLDWVERVARELTIPFSVGGGIRSVGDMRALLLAGAEKVSLNTAAVHNPELIDQGAKAFGNQCIVLGMDVQQTEETDSFPSGYQIVTHGGRQVTDLDALAWAQQAESRGAGELCLNSIDADGTRAGYDLELMKIIAQSVGIPVIASGGAGSIEDILSVFQKTGADAALLASILHFGETTLPDIKDFLKENGIHVRS